METNTMNKNIILSSAISLILSSTPFSAMANNHDEIEALKAQVKQLSATLNMLNTRIEKMETAKPKVVKSTSSWNDRIKIKGDFRYRYENQNVEPNRERERQRIRARVGIYAEVNDTVDVGVQIATGGNNATSTNQTLDDGFTTKSIDLDLAYFDWHPNDNLSILGGKIKNPFYRPGKSSLIWDGDIRPEGLTLKYTDGPVWLTTGGYYIEEEGDDQDETFLFAGQTGLTVKSDAAWTTFGLGYFNFEGTEDDNVDGSTGNNTIFGAGLENDYEVLEAFAIIGTKMAGMPVELYLDYIKNIATNKDNSNNGDNDTGYRAGINIGKAKKPGQWKVGYAYQDLENDATVDAFSDSDFGGGGTDNKGHIFKAGYAVAKNWSLAAAYLVSETGGHVQNTNYTDDDRLQLDLKFKFK
jgi:hypothetical protein